MPQKTLMNVLYAVFRDQSAADRAVSEVQRAPECTPDHCEVVTHADRVDLDSYLDAQSLAVGETDALPAHVRGVLLGGVTGTGVALLMRWALDVSSLSILATILFGAMAGMLFGGLAAVLIGVGVPDRQLHKLKRALTGGSVLVTFSVSGEEAREVVDSALRRNGAREVREKHVV